MEVTCEHLIAVFSGKFRFWIPTIAKNFGAPILEKFTQYIYNV